ncbi:DUF4870 domain-containing protein [Ruania alba]|uniref:DUF4870 domain-containing protein n=1 Tax=Ruania alba TaxID=648782 RepID=UPI001587BE7C|nr:DUF4870 domain-containing protein [Ruania alba]
MLADECLKPGHFPAHSGMLPEGSYLIGVHEPILALRRSDQAAIRTPRRNYDPAALPQQARGDDRTIAILAHLSPIIAMIVSIGFVSIAGPLLVWLIWRDRGRWCATPRQLVQLPPHRLGAMVVAGSWSSP